MVKQQKNQRRLSAKIQRSKNQMKTIKKKPKKPTKTVEPMEMVKQQKNQRRLSAKIQRSKNQLKTIKKKPKKPTKTVEPMEVDIPNASSSSALKKQVKLNINKKKRRLEKFSKNAVEHLPESTPTEGEKKVKRSQKINEDRLRPNDCPLFVHPNAANLKNVVRDENKATVVVPTRRVGKKKIRKLLKAKQRDERAAERAAKAMDTS
uniref:Uncharacterized protein n=1 Tax=Panagrolaimus sp. JU765 TaxID=591449 RepID=A0AC34QU61_9BILA